MKKSIPPSQLLLLGISGFRSYDFKNIQKIKLQGNLTLIWGLNGSGKSTILQLLKFLLTGVAPPNTDKGKTFIMNPKVSKTHKVIADGRIKFRSASGREYIIVRKFQLSRKSNNTLQIKSLVQQLRFLKDNQQFALNKKVTDLPLLAEQLLQISNSTLKYISFCHQEQAYWPFSQNVILKEIFDEILETHKLHQCLQSLQDCLKKRKKQQKDLQKQIQYAQFQLNRTTRDNQQTLQNVTQMQEFAKKLATVKRQHEQQKQWISQLQQHQDQQKVLITQLSQVNNQIKYKNQKISMYKGASIVDIQKTNELLQQLEASKTDLIQKNKKNEEIYTQLKKSEQKSQINNQINIEVSRVREMFPEFKLIQFQKEIVQNLNKKCKYFQGLQQQTKKLQKKIPQLAKIMNKNILSIKGSIQELEKNIKYEDQKMKRLHQNISGSYKFLYKEALQLDAKQINFEVQMQLNRLKWQMEQKKQQIESCKGIQVPKKSHNIEKMRFAGIQMQQQMICYCRNNKKCMFCDKKMDDEQIERFIEKRQKTISTYQKQIQKLEQQQLELGQPGQDPQKIILKNQHFLKKATEIQRKLLQQLERLTRYRKNEETKQTNQKLHLQLKRLEKQIQKQFQLLISASPQKCTLREYQQLCSDYIDQSRKIKILTKSLKQQKQELRINQIYVVQNERKENEIRQIKQKIQKLNDELSLQHSTRLSYQTLQNLYQRRDRAKSLDKRQKTAETLSSVQQKLSQMKKQIEHKISRISNLKQSIEFTKQSSILQKLNQQKKIYDKQFQALVTRIKQLKININKFNDAREKYGSFKAQYDMRQKKIKQFCQHTKYYELYFKNQLAKKQIFQLNVKCKAFQKSISLVHQEQLKRINAEIQRIWKIIYHDDDIDTIEIHVTPDQGNSQRKKSYHYRILMIKGQLQRVMNGACSSGQKILACLVIRIALCKTLNKGQSMVIALDQPTAHLDSMHTERLAQQIKTLIKMFHNRIQFLIISHDSNFVKDLSSVATNYYHVQRNEEGYSHLRQASSEDMIDCFQRRQVVVQIGE